MLQPRALGEILVLFLGVIWQALHSAFTSLDYALGPEDADRLVRWNSVAVMTMLVVLATLGRRSLPRMWLEVSRSSPDNGVIYLVLPPMVTLSLLESTERDTLYFSLMFWTSVALAVKFVLDVLFPGWSMLAKLGGEALIIAGATFLWWTFQVAASNHSTNVSTEELVLFSLAFIGTSIASVHALVLIWLKAFSKSFTVGEAMVVIHGFSLCIADGVFYFLPQPISRRKPELSIVIQGGLSGVIMIPLVFAVYFQKYAVLENETVNVNPRAAKGGPPFRWKTLATQLVRVLDWSSSKMSPLVSAGFYAATSLWLVAVVAQVMSFQLGGTNPIVWVWNFTFQSTSRPTMLIYWAVVLGTGLPCIHMLAAHSGWPLIVTRKLYHLLALLIFGPSMILTPDFMALSFAIACALLLYIEYIRICRVPPLGKWLHSYLRSYTDSRDEGTTILTHIYLLVGCALPLWLFRSTGNPLATCCGLVVLGAGDAAGAIVGSNVGRCYWPGGRKTVEGTIAMFVASLATLVVFARFESVSSAMVAPTIVATVLTCLLEALTKQIDNLILPLFFAALLIAT